MDLPPLSPSPIQRTPIPPRVRSNVRPALVRAGPFVVRAIQGHQPLLAHFVEHDRVGSRSIPELNREFVVARANLVRPVEFVKEKASSA